MTKIKVKKLKKVRDPFFNINKKAGLIKSKKDKRIKNKERADMQERIEE